MLLIMLKLPCHIEEPDCKLSIKIIFKEYDQQSSNQDMDVLKICSNIMLALISIWMLWNFILHT